eukprot:TRINITY_DN7109_c0_g5_i1.p2 TRINITY_DN7109_c0_g5~~TRINITY_DN7109_c0_g5_i1.p2  ORF type:complete len:129 (+),score=46.33 TRINITY_DN7109_c0_g5_i1:132-518(+)
MKGEEQKHRVFKKRENGRNFWNFMHTLAAYYPAKPTCKQVEHMDFFVKNCADYFLIESTWANTFNKNVREQPPKLDSQESFVMWMCAQHNQINERIGKPLFPCTVKDLTERWGPVTLPDDQGKTNIIS